MSRMVAAALVVGLGAFVGATAPAGAADRTYWLSSGEVSALFGPGGVWCFEPQPDGCFFQSINKTLSGDRATYAVAERWDEPRILVNHVGGTIRPGGQICERNADYMVEFEVLGLDGQRLGPEDHAEIAAEVASYDSEGEPEEYCYRYAITDPARPALYTQVQYAAGVPTGDAVPFIVDFTPGAAERFGLRLP